MEIVECSHNGSLVPQSQFRTEGGKTDHSLQQTMRLKQLSVPHSLFRTEGEKTGEISQSKFRTEDKKTVAFTTVTFENRRW